MSTIRFDMDGLNNGLQKLLRIDAALGMYCNTKAAELQAYAQSNRPWTDRTGMAKATLKGTASQTDTGHRITLAHGVEYGVWLELANEKRYAIVEPTIRLKAPEVIRGVEGIMDRIR